MEGAGAAIPDAGGPRSCFDGPLRRRAAHRLPHRLTEFESARTRGGPRRGAGIRRRRVGPANRHPQGRCIRSVPPPIRDGRDGHRSRSCLGRKDGPPPRHHLDPRYRRPIRLVVGTLEAVQDAEPRKDARHRIEHYELPDDEVLRRTKTARIVASCQPNFIGQWSGPGDVYETRLGVARAAKNNPYRKILRRRIPLCFGSDGMPYGPLYGVHWAVNGFLEDQRISPEEAVRAATAGSAFAAFEEDDKGTLEPGKLADFVILDGDPFETPEAIARMRVASTWIGGRRVYAASPKS